jgi:hypothetical protein
MFPTQRNDMSEDDNYASYPDLIIAHCMSTLTCHTVPHKYAQLPPSF